MSKSCRVQFDLTESAVSRIDELISLSEASTRKNYVENALVLMEWALAMAQKGYTIAAVDENSDSFREVTSPLIANIRRVGSTKRMAATSG
jgi:hypothetical protein